MNLKTKKLLYAIISLICFIVSIIIFLYVDWRIAVGVFLFTMANNLQLALNITKSFEEFIKHIDELKF